MDSGGKDTRLYDILGVSPDATDSQLKKVSSAQFGLGHWSDFTQRCNSSGPGVSQTCDEISSRQEP